MVKSHNHVSSFKCQFIIETKYFSTLCGKPTLDGKIDSLNAFYHVDRITTSEK